MSDILYDNFYSCKEIHKEGLELKYEIIVNSEYIENQLDNKLSEIAKQVKSPGFRTGKVPYGFVVKNYGEEAKKDIIKTAIDECADDLIKKNKLDHLVSSNVKVISLPDSSKKDDLVYELSLEVMPEVPLLDLSSINMKLFEAKVEDGDIKDFISSVKSKSYNFTPAPDDHLVASGDKVVIDFEGRIKGKLFKGGSAKGFTAEVNSGQFLSDFDNNLIGMKRGELKNLTFKIPEDYNIISLAGKEADFSVKVNDVLVSTVLDDDGLAKSNGFEDHAKFTDYIVKRVNFECHEMSATLIRKDLFDYIDKNYNFELPNAIIRQEQKKIEEELKNKDNSMDYAVEAKRRVKLGMLLIKFGQENKISINQEDILNLVLKQYVTERFSLDDVLKLLKSNRKFYEVISGQAFENKVTNYILEKISKEKQVISVKELKAMLFDKEE